DSSRPRVWGARSRLGGFEPALLAPVAVAAPGEEVGAQLGHALLDLGANRPVAVAAITAQVDGRRFAAADALLSGNFHSRTPTTGSRNRAPVIGRKTLFLEPNCTKKTPPARARPVAARGRIA